MESNALTRLKRVAGKQTTTLTFDSSQSMIDEARQRNVGCKLPLQFERGDAGHLRWHSNHFDACRADRVFQHLPDPERAFERDTGVLFHNLPGNKLDRLVKTIRTGGL